MQIPLALKAGDYGSIKNRGQLVNLIAETNKAEDYITVRRCEGLSLVTSSANDEPARSNFHENGGYIYYVADTVLYRFLPPDGTPVSLGTVGGSGRAQIESNSVPGANQTVILNGEGLGYVYESGVLTQITDPDFYPTTSMAILNERFWFTRDGTNEFFASDVADATSYNPLSFGTAEWKPDNVKVTVSKKSALWVIGTATLEYYQSFDDPIFPLRAVRGASYDIGILAQNSFAELDDYFAFLADNSNIALINGTELTYISDLEFSIKIRGDGTAANPGFTNIQIQNCIGFFVDTPQHKVYYLSFPLANYTWGYDLMTGLTLTRSSYSNLAWRGIYSLTYQNRVYMGDYINGNIWLFTPDAKTEGGEILPAMLTTPSVSFKTDSFFSLLEVEMEVGVAEAPGTNPLMIVYISKNGGKTYLVHSHIPLGGWGDFRKRVPIREIGRLVRHKDIMFRFLVTDAVRVQFYDIEATVDFDD
jgi:hypothetical protein